MIDEGAKNLISDRSELRSCRTENPEFGLLRGENTGNR